MVNCSSKLGKRGLTLIVAYKVVNLGLYHRIIRRRHYPNVSSSCCLSLHEHLIRGLSLPAPQGPQAPHIHTSYHVIGMYICTRYATKIVSRSQPHVLKYSTLFSASKFTALKREWLVCIKSPSARPKLVTTQKALTGPHYHCSFASEKPGLLPPPKEIS